MSTIPKVKPARAIQILNVIISVKIGIRDKETPFPTIANAISNNGEHFGKIRSGKSDPSICITDLTVIDQFATAKETPIFDARIGSVGPVILNEYIIQYIIELTNLKKAPIAILVIQKAAINHFPDASGDIIYSEMSY